MNEQKLSNEELRNLSHVSKNVRELIPRGLPEPVWLTDQIRLLDHIAAQAAELEALRTNLKLLVKLACREQRYECVDALRAHRHGLEVSTGVVQNALCPNVDTVIEMWEHATEKPNANTR